MATERRLIDANALSKSIKVGSGTDLQKFFADVCLATAPTVDAVPVVRCKDCENCYPVLLRNGEVYFYKCEFHDVEIEPDDFCSYGERRTDNG